MIGLDNVLNQQMKLNDVLFDNTVLLLKISTLNKGIETIMFNYYKFYNFNI